jgi:hypothetical protein
LATLGLPSSEIAGILSGLLTVNADTLDLVLTLLGRQGNGYGGGCRVQ